MVRCENNIAILEAAHDDAGEGGLIIIIGHLGDGEYKRMLNQRRLHNARAYLTEYLSVRSPKTIVTAEGERVSGYGRINLYVRGKLFYSLPIKRNGDFAVGSCEPAELDDPQQRVLRRKLYPWRDANPSRKKT